MRDRGAAQPIRQENAPSHRPPPSGWSGQDDLLHVGLRGDTILEIADAKRSRDPFRRSARGHLRARGRGPLKPPLRSIAAMSAGSSTTQIDRCESRSGCAQTEQGVRSERVKQVSQTTVSRWSRAIASESSRDTSAGALRRKVRESRWRISHRFRGAASGSPTSRSIAGEEDISALRALPSASIAASSLRLLLDASPGPS